MEAKVAPVITKYWVDDAFPFELLPAVKELGIGGLAMHGYGCAGEAWRCWAFPDGDCPHRPVVLDVRGRARRLGDGLHLHRRQKWLPPMARFEKIGCFGLTEPLVANTASASRITSFRKRITWPTKILLIQAESPAL
jgi:alkylation response protein AidB-like acyl-CoA dehydrogenase